MSNKRVVLLSVVLFGIFAANPAFSGICDHEYTVKGRLLIYDDITRPEGEYRGLYGIKVKIRDGFMDVAKTHTDSNGYFNTTFKSCLGKIKLSLKIIPTTASVNVSQALIPNYYKIKPDIKIKGAKPGTHNFGNVHLGSNNNNTEDRVLKVFYGMKTVLKWLKNKHGIDVLNEPGLPTGHVEIVYPGIIQQGIDSMSSFYDPLLYVISVRKDHFIPYNDDMDVLPHEFAHLFQDVYGNYKYAPEDIDDYRMDGSAGWSYASREEEPIANLEGFATFIEYLFMIDHGFEDYLTIESTLNNPDYGKYGVVNHTAFFYDLFDSEPDQDEQNNSDNCQIPLAEIVSVFAKNTAEKLSAFAIMDDGIDEFISRYESIYGPPPEGCDFSQIKRLNFL